jgi:hypothetical protein
LELDDMAYIKGLQECVKHLMQELSRCIYGRNWNLLF